MCVQVINLAAICTPADYNTRPLDTIYSNFVDALPVVQYCRENGKRLIHFSTCEVYGKTIGSYLPKDHPLKADPAFYMLKEDETPCIFGSVDKQRWSYACAKQLIERLIFGKNAPFYAGNQPIILVHAQYLVGISGMPEQNFFREQLRELRMEWHSPLSDHSTGSAHAWTSFLASMDPVTQSHVFWLASAM